MNNIQQEELLKEFRANIFSGSGFSEGFIKKYSGLYKGFDIPQIIEKSKSQMEPASLPDISFDKIVKLHQSRDRIDSLKDSHPEYLLNEFLDKKDEKPFEWLSTSFDKNKQDKDRITEYIKYLEDRARKQETKDTKDRLFETIRDFTQLCKEFLLNSKYESLYPVLTQNYKNTISKISDSVSKVGINIIAYHNLAEECYDLLKRNNDERAFQYILALINLRCQWLKVNIPVVNAMVTCPNCGDKEQSGNICTKCGAYIKCPGCGGIIKNAKCSGCGIEIENIDVWLNKIKEADKKISVGDYESAEQLINPVKTKWAKNEQVAVIIHSIADIRTKVTDYETIINESIAKHNYFTAQRYLDEIKRKAVLPAIFNAKENDIRNKIEQAVVLANKGDKESLPIQKIDSYSQAISLVADFDEAINKLKNQNILPCNLTCRINGKQVQLSWNNVTFKSLSIKYAIYKEDVTNRKQKTEIIKTSESVFMDTIAGGISCFYYVQIHYNINGTDISGVWDEVKSQEIIVPDEVVDCKTTIGDKRVRIEFTPNPNAADYELYKAAGSGKKEILKANLRSGSFTDTEVKNDVRYTYTLVSVFKKTSGEIVRSQGIEIYATPLVPPEPVKKLDYSKTGEVVTLEWNGIGKSNDSFRILQSGSPINKPIGFTASLAEMEKLGKITTPLTASKTECALFAHAVRNYFSIWSLFGDIVIAGAEVEILNVTEVSNAKAYISSGKLYVEWDWPSNCKQVCISYSNESYTDSYKTIKKIPRELYDQKKAFVIESVLDKDYYIEIATQHFEGNHEMISSGVRLKLSNSNPMTIKYTVKVSSFLRKKLTLKIENDNNKRLPELVLVSSPAHMPTRREDGTAIYVIPDGTSCGTFVLDTEHIRKNYYARLFLSDTSIKNIRIITPDKEQLKLY